MEERKLERLLGIVDPARRSAIKKLVVGFGFAVPTITSFSVKNLAFALSVSDNPVTSDGVVTSDRFTTTF